MPAGSENVASWPALSVPIATMVVVSGEAIHTS